MGTDVSGPAVGGWEAEEGNAESGGDGGLDFFFWPLFGPPQWEVGSIVTICPNLTENSPLTALPRLLLGRGGVGASAI